MILNRSRTINISISISVSVSVSINICSGVSSCSIDSRSSICISISIRVNIGTSIINYCINRCNCIFALMNRTIIGGTIRTSETLISL